MAIGSVCCVEAVQACCLHPHERLTERPQLTCRQTWWPALRVKHGKGGDALLGQLLPCRHVKGTCMQQQRASTSTSTSRECCCSAATST